MLVTRTLQKRASLIGNLNTIYNVKYQRFF
jgi:hypothetical protein